MSLFKKTVRGYETYDNNNNHGSSSTFKERLKGVASSAYSGAKKVGGAIGHGVATVGKKAGQAVITELNRPPQKKVTRYRRSPRRASSTRPTVTREIIYVSSGQAPKRHVRRTHKPRQAGPQQFMTRDPFSNGGAFGNETPFDTFGGKKSKNNNMWRI